MGVKPRAYNSPERDERANATRRRILEAAAKLFAERGFAGVTMRGIAHDAAVSLATVYLYFPGKPALVAGLVDEVVSSGDLSVERVEAEAAPVEQLRTAAHIIRMLNERSWLVVSILRSAHGIDDELSDAWRLWQLGHLHAVQRAITALEHTGALRAGLMPEDAVDIAYALAGTDVYRALVRERGWSHDRYEAWLLDVAQRELLSATA
jgi:AcrR family transcriptional regulator